MDITTIVILVSFAGILFGAKRPLFGCIAGLIIFPALVYFFLPTTLKYLIISAIAGTILGGITGFVSSIFYSGLKGKGHNSGPSYIGGFGGRGGQRPGGIILSDEEREHHKK